MTAAKMYFFWEKQIGFIHFRNLLTFGIDAVCFIIVKVIFIFFPKVCQKRGIQITPNDDLMVGKSMNFLNCILEA